MFRRILAAFDGSDAARRGLGTAIALAADQRATLFVLHVLEGMPAGWSAYVDNQFRPARVEALLQGLRVTGHKVLDEAQAMASDRGVTLEPLLVDARGSSVAEVILAQIRAIGADVVVLGTHGREGMSRLVMGSAAETVLRHAEVPVLLVRGPARAQERTAPNREVRSADPVEVDRGLRAAGDPETV
jgi:nucleotide-binding universal stress UspA family protein